MSTQEQLNAPGTVVAKLANGTVVTDGMTVSKGAQVVLSGSPDGESIQYHFGWNLSQDNVSPNLYRACHNQPGHHTSGGSQGKRRYFW